MKIVDLRDCPASGLFYGGHIWPGRKEHSWTASWASIRVRRATSRAKIFRHASGPVSEHLGARIYASLGIPVHETMLGYRNGKIVCACRDFTFPGKRLFEFKDIKNALSDDDGGFDSAPSDGESVFLGDVLATIETSDLLRSVPGVLERFWDMFVVDAFIKNPGRSNGNWGVLMDASFSYELAPVYDLGSSLFGKRGDSLARRRMLDESDIDQDAFGTNVSCYRLPSGDGRGASIHPFSYMAQTVNPDLDAAIKRFMGSVDMDRIDALSSAEGIRTAYHVRGRSSLP